MNDSSNEKKKMMIAKYTQSKFNIEDYKKYYVYKKPIGTVDLFSAELVVVCENMEQAIHEITYRLEFIKTGNKEILFKNDPRFKTFEDDSDTGKEFKDYIDLEFETPGEFFILETFT